MVLVRVDVVRRSGPRSGPLPGAARGRAGRHHPLLHGDHRRHRRPGVRVQAADRPLRRGACRAATGGGLLVHPRAPPGRRARARRQARRHRVDGRAVRPRGVRALRRRRRHRQPLPRDGRRDPVPRARRRARPVPHEQPGQRRATGPRRRRTAAVRACRGDGGRAVVGDRRLRARRRRHLPRAAGRRQDGSSATCRSCFRGSGSRAATSRPPSTPARRDPAPG